jgi:hypothetical protein
MLSKKVITVVLMVALLFSFVGMAAAADCTDSQGLATYDPNLGSVSNNVESSLLIQCDGSVSTRYSYMGQTSNGRMKAPIVTNQTMFQTGYFESTFSTGGLTSYSNNVTTGFPTVAGDITTLTTDRNILFESNDNGVILTEEGVFTSVYGNFPMNGSKEAGIEGGSMIVNHISGFNSQFVASNLALSSQNNVISGTIDRPSPILGADPDLINLDSTIMAEGNSIGFSTLHAFSYDQTGLPQKTIIGADHSYSDSVTFTGNFGLNKDFHYALKSVPTIQTFDPTPMCVFDY